jgi:hypothetical protein
MPETVAPIVVDDVEARSVGVDMNLDVVAGCLCYTGEQELGQSDALGVARPNVHEAALYKMAHGAGGAASRKF